MKNTNNSGAYAAADTRIPLSEIYPKTTYGTVPVLDQYAELEAYRAFDDGGMEAVSQALPAYVDFHQHQWI